MMTVMTAMARKPSRPVNHARGEEGAAVIPGARGGEETLGFEGVLVVAVFLVVEVFFAAGDPFGVEAAGTAGAGACGLGKGGFLGINH